VTAAAPDGAVREELVEPLRRALAWLLSLRDAQGRIVCPEHKIEHTGKSAGAAVLAARLARHDPARRAQHVAAAIEQGRRLVANLKREGASECHTFWPGRHDPYNNSNAIIDGGACSDALAELVLELGGELSSDDRAAFTHASVLHARTYLRYAVLDKGVPAQRAWGLSGLAAAWKLERDETLETAAIQAIGALEAVQHPDGSFPYHPLEWGAGHVGASDVSAFYHSRIPGFTMFALEQLGRTPSDPLFARPIASALDFLEALQGPDGIKCGLVEAKPWYWGAPYEVASHPFDIYALARGAVHFDRERYARAALRAYRAWITHLAPNGMPRSHRDTPHTRASYQCPVFWACHAEWIARVLPDLERTAAREPTQARGAGSGIDLGVRFFPNASLARIEDDRVVAWIRGARPGFNVHHGSPHGAGLLRVVRKSDCADLVERERLAARQEAEWSGASGGFSATRGWNSSRDELRFSLWLARNSARGDHWAAALAAPFDVLEHGCVQFGAPAVSSAFDIAPEIAVLDDGVRVLCELAHRGGERAGGTRIEREFRVDGEGLTVAERVLERGTVRDLDYTVPKAARDVAGNSPNSRAIRYRLA
jgi:hypothetical protein